ncbi:hypothetical protein [Xylella fastidiosa]|uniref:hypothetical protein n=1 Tax=Xylella fastidiosa TaxID=2371 RepID=UPI003984AB50
MFHRCRVLVPAAPSAFTALGVARLASFAHAITAPSPNTMDTANAITLSVVRANITLTATLGWKPDIETASTYIPATASAAQWRLVSNVIEVIETIFGESTLHLYCAFHPFAFHHAQ